MPVRTGIYGGSFNPVHIGHLALANYLCEYGGLDEIWFMVSPQNPLKRNCQMADDRLRLRMVQSAIAGYSRFHASDFEFGLPRPSYTVNTLEKLSDTFPDREFVLVIGADNWATFPQWKAPEEILARHRVLIYPRPGYDISPDSLPPHAQAVQTPLLEISSTFIRRAIGQGKDVRYFLHPEVWKLIQDNKLYQTK